MWLKLYESHILNIMPTFFYYVNSYILVSVCVDYVLRGNVWIEMCWKCLNAYNFVNMDFKMNATVYKSNLGGTMEAFWPQSFSVTLHSFFKMFSWQSKTYT